MRHTWSLLRSPLLLSAFPLRSVSRLSLHSFSTLVSLDYTIVEALTCPLSFRFSHAVANFCCHGDQCKACQHQQSTDRLHCVSQRPFIHAASIRLKRRLACRAQSDHHGATLLFILQQCVCWCGSFSCSTVNTSLDDDPAQCTPHHLCLRSDLPTRCQHKPCCQHLAYSCQSKRQWKIGRHT